MFTEGAGGGWKIGKSIVLELDVAISFCCQSCFPRNNGDVFQELWKLLPTSSRLEYLELMGEPRPFGPILEALAILAGVMSEADYFRAAAAMRVLDRSAAMVAIRHLSGEIGASPEESEPSARLDESVESAYSRLMEDAYFVAGFPRESLTGAVSNASRDISQALSLMQGGARHECFWRWLDRFYYGTYEDWRKNREATIADLSAKAILALGGEASPGGRPTISWLPPENPLVSRSELARALSLGMPVFFWLDPFGVADLWLLEPGRVVASIAQPGPFFEAFRVRVDEVAARAAALGDPTRLAILRMIRQVGVTNTDMAAWLHLSRPTVSVHAKILRKAGLIRSRQEGRTMRHEIVEGELARLFADLADLLDIEAPAPAEKEKDKEKP